MQLPVFRGDRIIASISSLCLIFLIIVWINFFRDQTQDRRAVVASAVERNTGLAIALQQYTVSTIFNANAAVQLIGNQYETDGAAVNINRLFEQEQWTSRFFEGAAVVSANGEMISVSRGFDTAAWQGQRISNKDNRAKTGIATRIIISKPSRTGNGGKSVLNFSRLFSHRSNEAVVVIQTDPSIFTSFYDQANLLPKDIISLIALDGTTYARRTGALETNGENISKSPLFKHIRNNADSFYFAKDAIRGVPTLFSYRSIREYPMLATVGRAEEDVFAAFFRRRAKDLTYVIVTSVLVMLFSFLVTMLLLHRKRFALQQRKAELLHQRQLTQQIIIAQDRERESIGHELHDNVNQILTSVKLYLELIAQDRDQHGHLAPQAAELARTAIAEIRKLSHRLSAPTLGARSLVESIESLAKTVEDSSGIQISVDHRSYNGQLPQEQKLTFYRIIQEQFNNIIKHSDATQAWVNLGQEGSNTILTIRDNGKGFNSELTSTNGIGLKNMFTRADLLNGTMTIDTAPGNGCTIKVVMPN